MLRGFDDFNNTALQVQHRVTIITIALYGSLELQFGNSKGYPFF